MTLCPSNSDEATSQGPQPLISYLWVASPLSLQSLSTAEWGTRTHPPNSQTSPDMGLRGKERIAQCLGLSEKTISILLVSCHMLLSLPSAKSKPRSSTSERPRAAPVCTWSRERTATPHAQVCVWYHAGGSRISCFLAMKVSPNPSAEISLQL